MKVSRRLRLGAATASLVAGRPAMGATQARLAPDGWVRVEK